MAIPIGNIELLRRYLVSYPRVTLALIVLVIASTVFLCWRAGPLAILAMAAMQVLLLLAWKLIVMLWAAPKYLNLPRRIVPVIVAVLLLGGVAAALQLPFYNQVCANDPASLGESDLCVTVAPD